MQKVLCGVLPRWLIVVIALSITGCGSEGFDAVGGDNDTWLFHQGGVVCKGITAQPVAGPDVYVAADGDDANTGTSPQQAFATLAHALCNAAPGQTIHVGQGIYKESVLLSEFGQRGNAIRIIGESSAGQGRPILDGGKTLTYGIAIIGEDETRKSSGFIVENLEFRNYTDAGIIAVLAEQIEIRDCILRGNGFHALNPDNNGEGFGADFVNVIDLLIDGVEAVDNGPERSVWQRGILGNDIAIWGSQNVEVRNCYTHDGVGGGLLVEDDSNVLVENNRFTNAQLTAPGDEVDGAIWVDGGRIVTVRNNLIDDNRGPGLQISDEGVQKPTGYLFEGNIISNNDLGVFIWNFGVCPWPDTSIVRMVGNTFLNNSAGDHKCEAWACGVGRPCD